MDKKGLNTNRDGELLENHDMCSECGGKCCKGTGCLYSTEDFVSLEYEDLLLELKKGNISIVFSPFVSKRLGIPFLYLRSRNVDRDIVDLISVPNRCSMLRDDGCYYDFNHRPEGGRNLIPGYQTSGGCYNKVPTEQLVLSWAPYQEYLSSYVRYFSSASVEEKLERDMVCFFHDVAQGDMDFEALEYCLIYVDALQETYPDIYQKYLNTYTNDKAIEKPFVKKLFER